MQKVHMRDTRRGVGMVYWNAKYGIQHPVVCRDDVVTLSDSETTTTKVEDVTCMNCAIVVTGKVSRYLGQNLGRF